MPEIARHSNHNRSPLVQAANGGGPKSTQKLQNMQRIPE